MVAGLVSYPENCTGCRFCELICSLYHEGVVNPLKARLRVVKSDLRTDVPIVCTQCVACGEDCCVEICPQEAIREIEGVVTIDEEGCTGCGLCADSCPYGVIWVDDLAHKCDLCDGDPICVKFCPTKALVFEEREEGSYQRIIGFLEGGR